MLIKKVCSNEQALFLTKIIYFFLNFTKKGRKSTFLLGFAGFSDLCYSIYFLLINVISFPYSLISFGRSLTDIQPCPFFRTCFATPQYKRLVSALVFSL